MDLNFKNTTIAFCYNKTNELKASNAHQQKVDAIAVLENAKAEVEKIIIK